MGRRNKTYSKDLHQQAYDQLTGMLAFGESKKEAMATGTAKNKIFSHATYKNYWKHIKYFLGYIKEKHPECTTLKNAKKYVNEWLQTRVDQGLSAWTVQLEAKALGKLCFDLLLGNQILSPQLLQFSSPQAGPAAKFYQFIIVRLGEVFVPHPVTTAPFNLLTFSLGRLKVILVIRGNPV